MVEKGLRAWEKRKRKVGVFVTGFSSSYLSLSPRFLLPQPSFTPPPPPNIFIALSLSLFLHQQTPAPHSTLTFPPSFSLPSLLSPPSQKPPSIRDKKDQCGQENVVRKQTRKRNVNQNKDHQKRNSEIRAGYFKLKITARFQTAPPEKNLQPNESPTQRHSRSCKTRKHEKVGERWNDEGREK